MKVPTKPLPLGPRTWVPGQFPLRRAGGLGLEPARASESSGSLGSRLRFGRTEPGESFEVSWSVLPQSFRSPPPVPPPLSSAKVEEGGLRRAGGLGLEPARASESSGSLGSVAPIMLAVCLSLCPGALEAEEGGDWASFRGDAALSGVARGELPEKPEVLWTFDIPDGVEATAALVGERVFVGGMDGELYALSLADGKKLWTYSAEGPIRSSPAVRGGSLFFGDETGFVHAVDVDSGEGKWKFETQGEVTSSPNLAGGCVLVGSFDQYLYCLEPADGKVRWKVETEGPVNGSPAVSGEEVISAGCDGYLRTVHLSDGKEVSKVPLGGYVAAGAAVKGSQAFVGSFENEVLAVDLAKDEVLWRYRHPARNFPFYASAAVAGDVVVVAGRDKMVHALEAATGKARWTFPTRARIDASPVVLGDRVFVGGESGVFYALNLADGEVRWKFETGSGIAASAAIARGRLVVGTVDGTVYCFGRRPAKGGKP